MIEKIDSILATLTATAAPNYHTYELYPTPTNYIIVLYTPKETLHAGYLIDSLNQTKQYLHRHKTQHELKLLITIDNYHKHTKQIENIDATITEKGYHPKNGKLTYRKMLQQLADHNLLWDKTTQTFTSFIHPQK